jgi:hypothetical protein
MIDNKKIVVVTPAGRKRYLEILVEYILREKEIIDQYILWINTSNEEDIEYARSLRDKYPNFISLDERFLYTNEVGTNQNICKFFDTCIQEDTIYIRLDDDIVWLEPDFIKKLSQFRINNPDPFLIYSVIFNNAIIDSMLQQNGFYTNINQRMEYNCMDRNGWVDPIICEQKHRYILDNYIKQNKPIPKIIENKIFSEYERVSINSISWLGSTFSKFNGKVGIEEEEWLSTQAPRHFLPNMMYSGAQCIHYAFFTQRDYLDTTPVLEDYKKII